MKYLIISYRTVVYYFLLAILYRIMGKRQIGELGINDLIVSILIAQMAAMSIDNIKNNMIVSVLPILILAILEYLSTYLELKSSKIRNIIDGKESIIINKGIINYKEMLKQRFSIKDLLIKLREKEIKNIKDVSFAILEANGNLSIFKKNNNKNSDYPFPLILEGKIIYDTLKNINKSREWLINILNKEKINLEDIFYCFYKKDQFYIIKNSDLIK